MIISKTVEIQMSHNKLKVYYSNLGYDIFKRSITVNVNHLTKNSHVIINVKCDICRTEKKIGYNKYNDNIKKYGMYTCCNKCAQIKNIMTSIEKFGTTHYSKTNKHRTVVSLANTGIDDKKRETRTCKICGATFHVRKRYKKTVCSKTCLNKYQQTTEYKNYNAERTRASLLKKYGIENNFQRLDIIQKIRNTRIARNLEIPSDQLSDWKKYNREVRKITWRNRKMLFDIWDGYDYYDKEYIKNNLQLSYMNCNYPTVDHKVSVFYGFNNKIPAEDIAKIDNLCITKRIINSLKRTKTETEFLYRND